MRIAVIPARGGSKRIPRKNIKLFSGKPVIAWSILAAQKSELFDAVIVSTDDQEIAEISKDFGAEIPFVRPHNLSDDHTATVPVIAHSVAECTKLGMQIEWATCIYPCSPLIQIEDLKHAVGLAETKLVDFVYPVTEYPHPIQRAMRMRSCGAMEFLDPSFELTPTQDLDIAFHDAGQFYVGKCSAWLEHKRMHTAGIAIPIPSWRVADIDTVEDWNRAELIHRIFLS